MKCVSCNLESSFCNINEFNMCLPCYENEKNKAINPSHYTEGIECIDYIQSHNMSFAEGNIIKYITRYKQKNGMQDLLKAKRYLEFLIEDYREEV